MSDRGERYADKKLSYIDKRLQQTYRNAQIELRKKLADFNRKYAAQDKKMHKDVSDGKISRQQYKDWQQRQVFRRETWESKVRQVDQVMLHHNKYAMEIVNNSAFDVFAENYYAESFKANWIIQGIDWSIYNTQAIQRLIEDDPKLLPEWKIDEPKDYKWNTQKVNNIVQQGIIQGESIDQITSRLCNDLCTQNENRMRLFARTAITGAQNAGRQVQMNQAADMGIEVHKRWIATLDKRTRDTHRKIDGEEVSNTEDFSNGLEYPGDPDGEPEEVYNCRCTMETVYPKYEDRSQQWREGVEVDGVPYEEWKEGKKNNQSGVLYGSRNEIDSKARKFNAQYDKIGKQIDKLNGKYSDLYFKSLANYGNEKYAKIEQRMRDIEESISELRSKRDSIINTRDKYLYENGEQQLSKIFKQIKGQHTIEQDALAVNTITADKMTQNNCGSCSLAYDARRRGFDVQSVLSNQINNNVIETWWEGLKMKPSTMMNGSDARTQIINEALGWGEGARGIVELTWSKTTGHYFVFEVSNGECNFIDAQTGATHQDELFDGAVPGGVRYARTDDKPLTRAAVYGIRRKK